MSSKDHESGAAVTPPEHSTQTPNQPKTDSGQTVSLALPRTVGGDETSPPHQAGSGVPPALRIFGTYELMEQAGHGGMGIVYKARDLILGRDVALKMLRAGALDHPRELHRFDREARTMAQFRHPHIVPIYEVSEHAGHHFYTMAFVAGGSLADQHEKLSSNPRLAIELMAKVARAVHYAHERGILHRDLKPANILLDEQGEPLVTDFGLAKLLQPTPHDGITQSGLMMGTPPYMAPEQVAGKADKIGPATDVWALGVILYELLSGRRPFAADSREELLRQIETSNPPHLRALRRGLDKPLDTIVFKCLQKDPAQRYRSAEALADDLDRWLRGESILAKPERLPRRFWRNVRRYRWQVAAAGLMLLLVLAIAWASSRPGDNSSPNIVPAMVYRTVHATTNPPGARIVLVPLGDRGEPQPDKAIRPKNGQRTPVTLPQVPSGEYLVVAEVPDFGFHEVYRTVPKPDERYLASLYHLPLYSTGNPDGSVSLPAIDIPPSGITSGMTQFQGGTFTMGDDNLPFAKPAQRRKVDAFYLDQTEVTIGAYAKAFQSDRSRRLEREAHLPVLPGRNVDRSLPMRLQESVSTPPASHAVAWVTFHEAAECAELMGKRLMDEAEYEFAATAGGTQAFPWGNETREPISWSLASVGEADKDAPFDRTKTEPPVYGLYSNAAEWTGSPPMPYRGALALGEAWPPPFPFVVFSDHRAKTVRGPCYDASTIPPDNWRQGPRQRLGLPRDAAHPWLGFRCARSAKPRFLDPQ